MSKLQFDAEIAPERTDYTYQPNEFDFWPVTDALGFVIGNAKGKENADFICDALNEYDPGADKLSPLTVASIDECAVEMDVDDLLDNAIRLAGFGVDVLKFLSDEIVLQARIVTAEKAAKAARDASMYERGAAIMRENPRGN